MAMTYVIDETFCAREEAWAAIQKWVTWINDNGAEIFEISMVFETTGFRSTVKAVKKHVEVEK